MVMKTDEVCKLLGLAYRGGKVTWGYNAVKANLNKGRVYLLLLAADSSTQLRAKFLATCRKYGVQATIYGSKVALGTALGKPPCAVVGITDKNLAQIIRQKVQEVGA